jgi:hypothetical protein
MERSPRGREGHDLGAAEEPVPIVVLAPVVRPEALVFSEAHMKKPLLLAVLLLLVTCVAAHAGGVNIAWGSRCFTENPVNLVTFACNSNVAPASWQATMSFMVDIEMTDFVGVEITLEGISAYVVPDWWKMNESGCRANTASFSADKAAVSSGNCVDWTAGQDFSVLGYTWDSNRMHISAGAAIPADTPFDLEAGTEYYAGTLTFQNRKTIGAGSCAGCSADVVWGLVLIVAAGLDGRRDDLNMPIDYSGTQCLVWQRPSFGPYFCVVPVKAATTWGQLKSLYR